ncbi:MAG TPA: ATP-binding cassette domain-containing protein, partial [Opitutus sp.]|nr:ATP-binding cassette domain-containing protein [Opitutus sp.]
MPSPAVNTAPAVQRSRPGTLSAPGEKPIIEIDRVNFSYGSQRALNGISLNIEAKKVTAFIGPSGCGKSTLLRCLNRMNDLIEGARVTDGAIRIRGVDIN